MRREKKVKDKHILYKGLLYLAVVDYYRDIPARDGDMSVKEHFETLVLAQRFLAGFSQGMWEGHALTDRNYKEIDERFRHVRDSRETPVGGESVRPGSRPMPLSGRTFARLSGRSR